MEVNLVITYDISEDSIEVNLVIRFVYLHAVPDTVHDKVLTVLLIENFQKGTHMKSNIVPLLKPFF